MLLYFNIQCSWEGFSSGLLPQLLQAFKHSSQVLGCIRLLLLKALQLCCVQLYHAACLTHD